MVWPWPSTLGLETLRHVGTLPQLVLLTDKIIYLIQLNAVTDLISCVWQCLVKQSPLILTFSSQSLQKCWTFFVAHLDRSMAPKLHIFSHIWPCPDLDIWHKLDPKVCICPHLVMWKFEQMDRRMDEQFENITPWISLGRGIKKDAAKGQVSHLKFTHCLTGTNQRHLTCIKLLQNQSEIHVCVTLLGIPYS